MISISFLQLKRTDRISGGYSCGVKAHLRPPALCRGGSAITTFLPSV